MSNSTNPTNSAQITLSEDELEFMLARAEWGGFVDAARSMVTVLNTPDPEGKCYVSNAFSLQMVSGLAFGIISIAAVTPDEVPKNAISVIGHPDTAAVVSAELGREVPFNRASIQLEPGDTLFVAQLQGGRLPEGATTLPDGFSIKWYRVILP